MRISDILSKIREVSAEDKRTLFFIVLIAAIIGGLISSILTETLNVHEAIATLVSIMVTVFFQGMYLFVLQCLNNETEKLTVSSTLRYGIKKFKNNVGTYLIYNVIQTVILYLATLMFTPLFAQIAISGNSSLSVVLVMLLLVAIMLAYLSYFGLTFYVLERYPESRGVSAMMKSVELLNGYRAMMMKLNVLYAMKALISTYGFMFVSILVGNTMIIFVLVIFLFVYLIKGVLVELLIATGVVFEEAYYSAKNDEVHVVE